MDHDTKVLSVLLRRSRYLLTWSCYNFSFASHTLHRINLRMDQSFRFNAGMKLAYLGLGRWLPSLKQEDWSCHVCVPLPNLCPQPSWRAAWLLKPFDTEEDSCTWFEGPATKHFTFLWKRMKTCGISKTSEHQAKQLKQIRQPLDLIYLILGISMKKWLNHERGLVLRLYNFSCCVQIIPLFWLCNTKELNGLKILPEC